MQTIKPFIELGWHTIPLKGQLKRLKDGKKTLPIFQEDWLAKNTEKRNKKATKIGGALTGKLSGIVAIDCDNEVTFKMFRSLDPEYEFIFLSKGKGSTCGTFIYQYTEDLDSTFRIKNELMELDFYSAEGMVYLPTESNETKYPFNGKMPELGEMPAETLALLRSLNSTPKPLASNEDRASAEYRYDYLAPLVEQFVKDEKVLPGLFKIITPKEFRTEEQYVKQGYLDPKNVPDGGGSRYLSQVSAILGRDPSIDTDTYYEAMTLLNDLWDDPMTAKRLEKTITDPMVEGKTKINGEVVWRYDEQWKQKRLVLNTKRQTVAEVGYDSDAKIYYCVDVSREQFSEFETDAKLNTHLQSYILNAPKKPDLIRGIPIIDVQATPAKPFGFSAPDTVGVRTFNTFQITPEMAILKEPDTYRSFYSKPETTLKFLNNLVPDKRMRGFLLRFLKHKLTTFEYSPVVLHFIGVPGSGKDSLVRLLSLILGDSTGRVAKPSAAEFIDRFSGFMRNSIFVHLDEYSDQLSGKQEREKAHGKLKTFTGSPMVEIREMRTDGYRYKHNVTFISTSQGNPFALEPKDRRVALFHTPHSMDEIDTDMTLVEFHQKLDSEIKDFCYYLATKVGEPAGNEYVQPPATADKMRLIVESSAPSRKIAIMVAYGMREELLEYAEDNGVKLISKNLAKNILTDVALLELYASMVSETDETVLMRTILKSLRELGITYTRFKSKSGENLRRVNVKWLDDSFDKIKGEFNG